MSGTSSSRTASGRCSTRKAALSLEGASGSGFPKASPRRTRRRRNGISGGISRSPKAGRSRSAQLPPSADDQFSAKVNGTDVGRSGGAESWKTGKQFDNVAKLLKPGKNVLTIVAENMPAPTANPAGLIAKLEVQFTDGAPLTIISDGSCGRRHRRMT